MLIVAGLREARAEIPSALEPRYADAVLAYHSRQFDKAQALLRRLLAQSPELPEFLELQALAFRDAGQDAKAAETYARLLRAKSSAPAAERAPYQFELGSLHFKAAAYDQAVPELEGALEGGFNPGVAHFFLGMIAYQKKDWPAAEEHLEKFRADLVPDLRPMASLYLAQAYSESGYGLGATQAYFDARAAAGEEASDPAMSPEGLAAAKSVLDSAEQGLAPVSSPRFFADVGLLFGYDSNALSLPGTETTGLSQQIGGGIASNGAAQVSGERSAEAMLLANAGYMTSPLSWLQLVPSYRLRMNYGEQAAYAGNFATNTLSLYLNHAPLSRLSYGVKLEGDLIFQEQIDDPATGARSFHPYILSGGFGPYARWQLLPYWALSGEAFFQPEENYTDSQIPNSPALFQSGQGYHLKAMLKKTGGSRWLNPGFYLAVDVNDTSGSEYRSWTPGIGIDDELKLVDKLSLIAGFDFGIPIYAAADRVDKTASAYLSATWLVWRRLSLLGTASYTSNVSNSAANDGAYSYDRGTISGGASWSVF